MKVYEIGTGYTPIPATMGAATEIVVEELTKAFQTLNVSVEIVDIKASERRPNSLPISEVWVPSCFIGTDVRLGVMHKLKRVVYSIFLVQKLKKILKHSSDKVVLHFHNQYNMFFFLKLTGKKLRKKAVLAYTVHSYIWHDSWDQIKTTIAKRYFQEVYCLKKADFIFVLNEQTRTNVISHAEVNPRQVTLIDNGVNTEIYQPIAQNQKDELKKAHCLSGKKVLVQVGSVCDRKNQLDSVRMLTPLMKKDRDIVFCYAGGVIEPEYQQEIEHHVKEHGLQSQVLYFGELSPGKELNEFYNMAEALVFPSKAEGFSLVVIEAMAAGLPVVINQSLQFPLAGECLQYTDQTSFLDVLQKQVFSDDAENLKKHMRQLAQEQYGWKVIAQNYLDTWSK